MAGSKDPTKKPTPKVKRITLEIDKTTTTLTVHGANLIDRTKFKALYPSATTLGYRKDGVDQILDYDDDDIILEDLNAVHHLVFPVAAGSSSSFGGITSQRRAQFMDILSTVRQSSTNKRHSSEKIGRSKRRPKKKLKNDNAESKSEGESDNEQQPKSKRKKRLKGKIKRTEKEANKRANIDDSDSNSEGGSDAGLESDATQSLQSEYEEEEDIEEKEKTKKKDPRPRVIYIHWHNKNKESESTYARVGGNLGYKKKAHLDRDTDYTLEGLTYELLNMYVSPANEKNLTGCGTKIIIGRCVNGQLVPVTEFVDDDGKKLKFWDYCDKYIKRANGEKHFYLMTIGALQIVQQEDSHGCVSKAQLSGESTAAIARDICSPGANKSFALSNSQNARTSTDNSFTLSDSLSSTGDSQDCTRTRDSSISETSKVTDDTDVEVVDAPSTPGAGTKGARKKTTVSDMLLARLRERVDPDHTESEPPDEIDLMIVPLQDSYFQSPVIETDFKVPSCPKRFQATKSTNPIEQKQVDSTIKKADISRCSNTSQVTKQSDASSRNECDSQKENLTPSRPKSSQILKSSSSSPQTENDSNTPGSPNRPQLKELSNVVATGEYEKRTKGFSGKEGCWVDTSSDEDREKDSSQIFHTSPVKQSQHDSKKSNGSSNDCVKKRNGSRKSESSSDDDPIKYINGKRIPRPDSSDEDIQPRDRQHQILVEELNDSIKILGTSDLTWDGPILGRGAQGTVRLENWRFCPVAVKSVNNRMAKTSIREILHLSNIRHPHIILCMAVCDHFCGMGIVMEYFESRELSEILLNEEVRDTYESFKDNQNFIARQICEAMVYLHSEKKGTKFRPIIHGDLKPSNVLMNKYYQVKLCDFGFSRSKLDGKEWASSIGNQPRGTFFFMAHEILLSVKKIYSTGSDMYAFGCFLKELNHYQPVWPEQPGDFDGYLTALENLKAGNVPNCSEVPDFLREKVLQCFDKDRYKRPKMEDFMKLFLANP